MPFARIRGRQKYTIDTHLARLGVKIRWRHFGIFSSVYVWPDETKLMFHPVYSLLYVPCCIIVFTIIIIGEILWDY